MADYPYFDLLDTPNPDESVATVTCEVNCLKLSQMPVEGVTTYAQFEAGDRSRVDEFGSYIYTTKTKPGAGLLAFHFGKPKTEAQKYTPWGDPELLSKDFYWPNTMERWRAEPDPTRALEGRDPNGETTFEMKWNAIYRLKPYVDGRTQIERLRYLAPTKFELQKPVILQPVSFGWSLPGDGMEPARMLIGTRIHRPNRVLGPAVISSTTYEPTTPSGWIRHLHDTNQEQLESGLWAMYEDYAIPPSGSASIRDK